MIKPSNQRRATEMKVKGMGSAYAASRQAMKN